MSPLRASTAVGLMLVLSTSSGCDPRRRIVIVTGTTIGLKATPGDGESRPPQVTLGYKRAELALVPTRGEAATGGSKQCADETAAKDPKKCTDAFSTMAAFDFRTRWFGATQLSSFISTGFAAREIQTEETPTQGERVTAAPNAFTEEFGNVVRKATVGPSSPDVFARRKALQEKRRKLTQDEARQVLDLVGASKSPKQPLNALQELIATTPEDDLDHLEGAISSLGH